MNNKVFAVIQMLLYPLYFITLFIPFYYEDHHYYDGSTSYQGVSFYDQVLSDGVDFAWFWFVIMLLTSLFTLYMCVSRLADSDTGNLPKFFSFSRKLCVKNRFHLTYLMPVICGLSLIIYSLLMVGDKVHVSYYEYYYELINIFLFLIPLFVIGLMFLSCIIDCAIGRKKSKIKAPATGSFSNDNSYGQTVGHVYSNQPSAPSQSYALPVRPVTSGSAPVATDEIKKLKELLDMGAITQEEFEIKKKQLLGL